MGQDTKIEWAHHTGNIWEGCTEVHRGCDHCYARVWNHRWGKQNWGIDVPRQMSMSIWNNLRKFQNLAAAAGEIHSVFVGSMMDIFEKPMPVCDSKGVLIEGVNTGMLRDRFFSEVSRGLYPNLRFLLLTKRPSNINKMIPEAWRETPPENIWYGTSPVDPETFNKLVRQLLEVKGNKFLSMEPLLERVDVLEDYFPHRLVRSIKSDERTKLIDLVDWVIVGGESGANKRPFNVEWARDIRDACKGRRIPFFMKQIDKVQEVPKDLLIRQFPWEKSAA